VGGYPQIWAPKPLTRPMGGSQRWTDSNEVLVDPLTPEAPQIFGVKVKPISGCAAETGNLSAVKMVVLRHVTEGYIVLKFGRYRFDVSRDISVW